MAGIENEVRYTVSMKDAITQGLNNADHAANQLTGTMNKLKEGLGVLGVGFAVFKGVEYVKEAVEKVEQLHQSMAQVEAALTSTRGAANLSMKELEESAASLASNTKFGRSDVFGMQSLLLTFTSVKDKIFNEAQPAIMDLATRMGGDLKGASIQVGKALNDPIQGMTALRRVGVSFSEDQKKVIQHLQQTGDLAGAQKIILKELSTEFGGSAKAAFDADPLAKFNKSMGSLQMAVGQAAVELLTALKPALDGIASAFKNLGVFITNTVKYFKEHENVAKTLGVVIGTATTLFLAYKAALVVTETYQKIVTAAQWLFNAALNANPIGIVITAIAVFAGAIYAAYQKVSWFRAGLWAAWAVIKEVGSMIVEYYKTVWDMVTHPLSLGRLKDDFGKLENLALGAGKRIGEAAKKGYAEGMADFNKKDVVTAKEEVVTAKAGTAAAAEVTPAKDTKPKGATGTKAVTINISIGKLIEQFKISTVNMQESSSKIQEMVANTLLQAINDSSTHAAL
jgi:hypothetical protein